MDDRPTSAGRFVLDTRRLDALRPPGDFRSLHAAHCVRQRLEAVGGHASLAEILRIGVRPDGVFDTGLAADRLGLTGRYGGDVLSIVAVDDRPDLLPAALGLCVDAFGGLYPEDDIRAECQAGLDPVLSAVALVGDRPIGTLLLGRKTCDEIEARFPGRSLAGIEGVALVVDKAFARTRLSKALIGLTERYRGADYVWGYELYGLNNLAYWLGRSLLVGGTEDSHVTAMPLRADLYADFAAVFGGMGRHGAAPASIRQAPATGRYEAAAPAP